MAQIYMELFGISTEGWKTLFTFLGIVVGTAVPAVAASYYTFKTVQRQAFEQEQTRIDKQRQNHEEQLNKQREVLWQGMNEALERAEKARIEVEQEAKKRVDEISLKLKDYEKRDGIRSDENKAAILNLERAHSEQLRFLSTQVGNLTKEVNLLKPYKGMYETLVIERDALKIERDEFKSTLEQERAEWQKKFEEMQKQIDELTSQLEAFKMTVKHLERGETP